MMSAMGEMSMPGGWTMSMMWMRTPDQSWPGAATSFLGMWVVMMVAMMLPSLAPMLWRYRRIVERTSAHKVSGARLGWLTTLVGTGYFFVWTAVGAAVFPIGLALSGLVLRDSTLARAVPYASAGVVLLGGLLQLTKWKARRIDCCSNAAACGRVMADDSGAAWRYGLRLGLRCVRACIGLMAIPLVMGLMDVRVMVVVAAAITAERLAPSGARVARGIGVFVIAAGLLLVVRAAT